MFNTLFQRLSQLIQPHRIQQLAKEHGWCQRRGKIPAFEFLFSALGQSSALDLTLNAQAAALSLPVTRQAIDQRYNPAATAFFEAAFQDALATSLTWTTNSPMVCGIQKHFTAVRIFDSTHCPCEDALAKIFPACGGGGGPAGLKVLLSYEYASGQLHPLAVLATAPTKAWPTRRPNRSAPGNWDSSTKAFIRPRLWAASRSAAGILSFLGLMA
jgi:hypothetical protein